MSFLVHRINHEGHCTVSGGGQWGLWATDKDEEAAGGLQSRDLEQDSEETLVLWSHVGLGRAPLNCSLDEMWLGKAIAYSEVDYSCPRSH